MPARPPVSLPTTLSLCRAACRCRFSGRRKRRRARPALRLVDDDGDVQQRLRRDAADVQADAAERRIAFDDHRLQAEVGRAESRRVAARAGAEHQHFAVDVGLPVSCGARHRRGGAAAGASGVDAGRRWRRGRRAGGRRRQAQPPASACLRRPILAASSITPACPPRPCRRFDLEFLDDAGGGPECRSSPCPIRA